MFKEAFKIAIKNGFQYPNVRRDEDYEPIVNHPLFWMSLCKGLDLEKPPREVHTSLVYYIWDGGEAGKFLKELVDTKKVPVAV